jgi:threonyl-tRNA synthetase
MPRRDKNQHTVDLELQDLRHRIRHSTSHVLAEAVLELFPNVKLGIGPATDDGFYYDFLIEKPFSTEDLQRIEARMRKTVAADVRFAQQNVTRDTAKKLFANEPFKLELIADIPEDTALSTYRHDSFIDLCAGPHVESTGQIAAFKLLSVAGAYWRGDEHRPMLQRIYGTAFESKEGLDAYLKLLEEAEKRDHRRLGKQLGMFSIHDEVGPGLVVWHPKGAMLRQTIEAYWRDLHKKYGYEPVTSPHIGRANLWQTSGHLDFYRESMYSPMEVDEQEYFIKPMNCPFHIMVYKSAIRSYRDLPMRLSEMGTVYRYERSGVLHGLLRVRGFTQDDAHIFCRPDQVEDEVSRCLDLTFELLNDFGFSDYEIYLSTQPEKKVGSDEMWTKATGSLEHALDARKLDYDVDEGGGAFYGPKIDIKIRDAIGRAWQCTTIQFDFNLPERFDLAFQGVDGQPHRPYMVHRAILGALERFIGVLMEHYAGAFPLWLAPTQAVVIPIADRHLDYARKVATELDTNRLRVEVDDRPERMNSKIRDAQLQKVPYMLIVGDKEAGADAAAVRLLNGKNLGPMQIAALKERLKMEITAKRSVLSID